MVQLKVNGQTQSFNGDPEMPLLWYLREQSLSNVYHRYGNLGARAGEERRLPQ